MPQRSKDESLDEAIRAITDKVPDHERLSLVYQQVVYLRKDFDDMKNNVMYKDTCEAKHNGQDTKIEKLESRMDKQEQNQIDGGRFNITTGVAIVALVVSIIMGIAVAVVR